MATKLGEITEFFSPGLQFVARGVEYTVPLASAELGIWCRMMGQLVGEIEQEYSTADMAAIKDKIEALPELPGGAKDFPTQMLGEALYSELRDAKLEDAYIQFVAYTAYIWIIAGEEMAERWYRSGGDPNSLSPANRAQRRAAGKTSTARATKTQPPVSSSGTRSPRKRAPNTSRAKGQAG